MTCTRDYALPNPGEGTPVTDWQTADKVTERGLVSFLCDLGQKSNGVECVECVSQCAYGRRYIKSAVHLNPEKDEGQVKPKHVAYKNTKYKRDTIQAYKDGVLLGEWPTRAQAARALNARPWKVSKALLSGGKHHGMTFRFKEVEDSEANLDN